MALSRIKTWVLNEQLNSADLNAEFNNILNNALSLISPLTADLASGGFRITGLSAGSLSNPSIQSTGDTNSGLYWSAADTVDITAGGVRVMTFNTAATGVNYWSFTPSAAGSPVLVAPVGADADIGITHTTKGTGSHTFSTAVASALTVTSTGKFSSKTADAHFIQHASVSLADDGAQAVELLVNGSHGMIIVTTAEAVGKGGIAYMTGGGASVAVATNFGDFVATDTDTKLCIFSDGDGTYTLKNRLGGAQVLNVLYMGI